MSASGAIAQISVNEKGEIEHARFYGSGLPCGQHDLWCAPNTPPWPWNSEALYIAVVLVLGIAGCFVINWS